jgi:hypothetical protein
MIFDAEWPCVREAVTADNAVDALERFQYSVGQEVERDGLLWVCQNLDVHRIPSSDWFPTYCVCAVFKQVKSNHPRLWGVTHA